MSRGLGTVEIMITEPDVAETPALRMSRFLSLPVLTNFSTNLELIIHTFIVYKIQRNEYRLIA